MIRRMSNVLGSVDTLNPFSCDIHHLLKHFGVLGILVGVTEGIQQQLTVRVEGEEHLDVSLIGYNVVGQALCFRLRECRRASVRLIALVRAGSRGIGCKYNKI